MAPPVKKAKVENRYEDVQAWKSRVLAVKAKSSLSRWKFFDVVVLGNEVRLQCIVCHSKLSAKNISSTLNNHILEVNGKLVCCKRHDDTAKVDDIAFSTGARIDQDHAALVQDSVRETLNDAKPSVEGWTSWKEYVHSFPISLLTAFLHLRSEAAKIDYMGLARVSYGGTKFSTGTGDGAPITQTPPPDMTRGATADLCDVHCPNPVDVVGQSKVQIMHPVFRDLGGVLRFSGKAATVKCFENNPLVRAALEEKGEGRVLVVDTGASMRCAVLGDNLAAMGVKNGWSGIIVNGCIRDSADIAKMEIGVKALATHPLKSSKRDPGLRDVPVCFAGVTVHPGDWVYADGDGVLVSPEPLV